MSYYFQKLIFLSSCHIHIIAILHFNLAAIALQVTFNLVEIDDM